MDSANAIRAAYETTDRAYRISESKLGCLVALVLVPAGVTLDYIVYPQHFAHFLAARIVCDIFIAFVFSLHFSERGREHIPVITFAWLMSVQIMISYMIYATDGYLSTYYAGLNLPVLAVGILLPTSVIEAVLFCAATIVLYVISCFANNTGHIEFVRLYNNIYFLILTAIISITAVYFNSRRRFSEFRLSYELDERNKELAELDRLKSEFFANVSHELRTPLTLILAPVEDLLQKSKELPTAVTGQLEIIRSNALRLLRLVNDLLEVIRLEEGRVKLDRRPLDLNGLLASVCKAVEPLAESRRIAFTKVLPDEPIRVLGDRSALEKVFFNLLSNAFKFTNEGGSVKISIRLGEDAVQVTVRDTGIGISERDLPFVFDRFRQADSSATRKYVGTGLGLALVKELTEKHDGKADIQSRLGEGTAITVRLPLMPAEVLDVAVDQDVPEEHASGSTQWHEQAAAQNAPPRVEKSGVDETEAAGGEERATVLVVDDEPDMQRYLVELLSKDYRVLRASDGRQGLALAQSRHPNLMVLDLMLPELDGLEVCRRLKGSPETRSTRIVLLTARADETSKLTALENGADDFLTKPFSGIEVQTRLQNLLRSARLERELQQRNDELQSTLDELTMTQNHLIHSEKLNALGRLSAGLLHEINNPLNYTLTALDVVKNDPAVTSDEELKDIFSDIDEGLQRIHGIVSELRAFAYPSKGEQQIFDLFKAIQGSIQMVAHERHDIAVHNEVDEELRVIGSRNHISQVLMNLLTNAFKAVHVVTNERSGEIRIRAEETEGRVYITVRDNGNGIPADTLERIFDPFYTTRDVGEGMGMGLSVCQTIIRNHGGELRVRSEEGAWTEFTFDLPVAYELSEANNRIQRDARERTA